MGPNIIQQEKQMEAISDEALQQLLRQMAQTNQVGTPGFILAAGELQGRKEARQQAMMGKGNPRPVIADLLMGDAMPPQMPMLPENAGGVAALPAPNMEGVATMAGGGLVAFSNGGQTTLPFDDERIRAERIRGARPGPGVSFAQAFPNAAGSSPRAPSRLGMMGRLALGPIGMLEAMTTPSEEDVTRLREFDRAKAALKGAGFSDKEISDLKTSDVYRLATGYGYNRAALNQADAALSSQPAAGVGAVPPAAGNQPAGNQPAGTTSVPSAAAPTAGVAPATAPTIDYKGAFEKAGVTAKELLGTAPTMPAEVTTKSVKEAVEADRKLFEELGIADPTKLRREQIEAEMKEAKSDKEQAGWMRLAEFGFNWASQNGSALQAAAKAGAAVAPGLISDLKELKKTERAQKRELAGLAALDAQAQRDMTAKARDRLDAKYESGLRRVDEHRKNIATLSASIGANAISSQTQLTTTGMTTAASRDVAGMQSEALKIERDLARKDARARTALDAAEQAARDISDTTERITAIKRYFAAFYNTAYGEGAGTAAPPRASGKVVNGVYVPAGK